MKVLSVLTGLKGGAGIILDIFLVIDKSHEKIY